MADLIRSPFPGMDPYLEPYWGDVHTKLATYIADELNPKLPDDLVARTEVYVGLYVDERKDADFIPDVSITETELESEPAAATTSAVLVAEQKLYRIPNPLRKQKRVIIYDVGTDGVMVTAIEILSPTNKGDRDDQALYRNKRWEFLRAGTSVVEIDLLRGGTSVLYAPAGERELRDPADYYVCAVRGWRQGQAEVYPIHLRERLPTIRVPLRRKDPDAFLDLQPLLDQVYQRGAYRRTIHYDREPHPPLNAADAAWADQLLKAAGKR
ncbi:MAG: DUF4058 family protein [Fimbriiglobus sp.]|jgi:hypothetical protein|nr:DUF4058 family protein [Fimbriiglobus sp.]